jgi:hypothetical protein
MDPWLRNTVVPLFKINRLCKTLKPFNNSILPFELTTGIQK